MHNDLPHSVAVQTHEQVPLLFVTYGRQSSCNLVFVHDRLQSLERLIFRVDMLGKGQVVRSVFMTVVHDCVVRESSEIGQRRVHVSAIAFKEAPCTSYEESIAGKDDTWLGGI